ncbi:MAG: 2-phospho-L-lactate guanylyltransferase [Actinomycetes bacterium]
MHTSGQAPWCLVVPVKLLHAAKSRLAEPLGARREDLALAMACDTVEAARRCPGVEVLVVTDDPRASEALAGMDVSLVPDQPSAGLNPALAYGIAEARRRHPGACVGALSADLPALRPGHLALALAEAAEHPAAFVADAGGTGTTLLVAGPDVPLVPGFGARSRARHAAAGYHEIAREDVASLRRDVDTEVDLADALRMGAGPRTAHLAHVLGLRSLG